MRWFEFDSTTRSGGDAALQPLNAREVTTWRPTSMRLMARLALTVSNKESLVFWSPPTERHPGVLFTADTDLSGISIPSQLQGIVATAPHHGSETNASAYRAIARAAQQDALSITWVRSDGRYRSRPGATYLSLKARRLCTLCRHGAGGSSLKQAVQLISRGGAWTCGSATVQCSCQ